MPEFHEFHTVNSNNPIFIRLSDIMLVGKIDGNTALTLRVLENGSPTVLQVRESYEQIRTILSRR